VARARSREQHQYQRHRGLVPPILTDPSAAYIDACSKKGAKNRAVQQKEQGQTQGPDEEQKQRLVQGQVKGLYHPCGFGQGNMAPDVEAGFGETPSVAGRLFVLACMALSGAVCRQADARGALALGPGP